MVKFLIKRPIAVTMTFIAILVLGIVAATRIPVSLMPDIDIPEITVQVSVRNTSAAELENTVVNLLRRQLMQVAHLADIKSETRDGNGLIHLDFEYGTDVDYAFIEVNEKIDRAMNRLPRNIERPRVIKTSATDIPVFYLNLTLKEQRTNNWMRGAKGQEQSSNNEHKIINHKHEIKNDIFPVSKKFIELSNFAGQVIRKRIEQLPEVAMVDISGQVFPELLILPDIKKLEALDINLALLEQAIRKNNINLGNLLIRDGQYQYSIRFESTLKNKSDIEKIYLKVEDRLLQLKDLAKVVEHTQERKGLVTSDGKEAITMAVIKQSDAQMRHLKKKLQDMVEHFRGDYPHIEFKVTRDQTQLLDYSMSNLGKSLLLGATMAFIIMFIFLRDFKSPFLIGITIPTSLVISLLFFHLAGISINIISLSGIILGVGMMIDNSIIVIDNITQHRERGSILPVACVNGTNEMFRPLLSSVLTTCAVFIPLIFVSGMAGALFFDQAMAIAIGLLVSLGVSITVLPVYYRLFYLKGKGTEKKGILSKINTLDYGAIYEKGFRLIMKNQGLAWLLFFLMLTGVVLLYNTLPKDRLPPLAHDEMMIRIEWNEYIHIDENNRRVQELVAKLRKRTMHTTCLIGEQQFLLDHGSEASSSEALIYIKTKSPGDLITVSEEVETFIEMEYPVAVIEFEEAGNIFNILFSENEPPLMAHLRTTGDFGPEQNLFLENTINKLRHNLKIQTLPSVSWQEHLVLKIDAVKLMAYDVTFDAVYRKLRSALNENEILLITQSQSFVPVVLGDKPNLMKDIIARAMVTNSKGEYIPLRNLVSEEKDYDLKTIVAGQEGEYYPLPLLVEESEAEEVMEVIRNTLKEEGHFEANFSGSIFSSRRLIRELAVIMGISLLLLYFILSSQFESLTLPLIVLIEVPVDIFGVFLFLKLFGAGINLMSLIGIIVMSGIIINDSILKIDTINRLSNQGYSLLRALVIAGKRRFKPIIMTSLTTILALLPFLFTSGIGADLQKPLALAVIGGMTIGTLVSLYFIPLFYYYLKRKSK